MKRHDNESILWILGSLAWMVIGLTLVTAMLSRDVAPFVYQGF